ncbi:MAG TPA: hypothetical protein VK544_00355 [Gemmatimonadaceae bacterium]|nr:hypothetical protein [Gemmatimonadaceae bacterium]
MSRLLLALCTGICLLAAGPTPVTAQERNYDENALRIEEHGGTISLVRGRSETVVAKIGVFRAVDVAAVVSPSPKAIAEATVFQRNYRPGTWLASLGIATLGAAIGASRINGVNQSIPTSLTIVSVSLITVGGVKLERANRALARAVWWYNRDLK